MRRVPAPDEKPLHWVGSTKRDFLSFPATVKDDMGNALGIAQFGGTAPTAKPWKGPRPRCAGDRRVTRRKRVSSGVHGPSRESIYVLHAFQRKSPSGIRTAKRNVELVGERLKTAARDYEEQYGKSKR